MTIGVGFDYGDEPGFVRQMPPDLFHIVAERRQIDDGSGGSQSNIASLSLSKDISRRVRFFLVAAQRFLFCDILLFRKSGESRCLFC